MKKYLFILAGLLCLIGQGEAEARAVKLGRVTTSTGRGIQQLSSGGGTCNGSDCTESQKYCYDNRNNPNKRECYCLYHPAASLCKKVQNCGTFCHADQCVLKNNEPFCNRCMDGYYANASGFCTKCPANSQPDGSGGCTCDQGYFKDGTQVAKGTFVCTSCNEINVPHANKGENYGIQCDNETGKVTGVHCSPENGTYYYEDYSYATNSYQSSNPAQNICQEVSWGTLKCAAGYRKDATSNCCIPMCRGVTCADGFAPTVENGKCCCKLKTSIEHCTAYDAALCTHCASGYYLNRSANKCVACGAHSSCDGSTDHLVCASGYFVSNWSGCYQSWSECQLCPQNATCGFGANGEGWHCNIGYYPTATTQTPGSCTPDGNGGYTLTKPVVSFGCAACSSGCAQCTGANSCTLCKYGYELIAGKCFLKKTPLYTCLPGQVWHPVLKRCTYGVCVANCAEPEQAGCNGAGYCASCMAGYYLTANGGCASCGSITPHCTRCSSQFTDKGIFAGKACTACARGYRLVNGSCQLIAVPLPDFDEMLIETNESVSFN